MNLLEPHKLLVKGKRGISPARGLVFAAVAVAGAALVVKIFAATGPVAFEAESGLLAGPAVSVSPTGASGGGAVKFSGTQTPTPTPSPTASPVAGCPPLPAYPDANCTGWQHTGATLLKVPSQATSGTGWSWNGYAVVATAPNATITNLDIDGAIDITNFSGVSVSRTYERCTTVNDWCVSMGSNSSLTDVEIGGGANGVTAGQAIGIYTGGPGNTVTRVHIHDTSDGMRTDGGTTVTDSYIHYLSYASFPADHSDGSQSTLSSANSNPIVFKHNRIQGGNNDGIFIQASTAFDIENNYFMYDNRAGQTISFGIGGGGTDVHGPVIIKNNVFETIFGPSAIQNDSWPAGTIISGNTLLSGTTVP